MMKLLEMVGMFVIVIVEMVSWARSYVKNYQVIHFKCVQYITCQLCFRLPSFEEWKTWNIEAFIRMSVSSASPYATGTQHFN